MGLVDMKYVTTKNTDFIMLIVKCSKVENLYSTNFTKKDFKSIMVCLIFAFKHVFMVKMLIIAIISFLVSSSFSL